MCRFVIDVNLLLKEHPIVNHHELITSLKETSPNIESRSIRSGT